MTHDRVFTNEFKLTHEFLGLMLGVSRPTVSVVAEQLRQAHLIAYHRGHVTVLDRAGLEAGTCECYATVKTAFDAFLQEAEHSLTTPGRDRLPRIRQRPPALVLPRVRV